MTKWVAKLRENKTDNNLLLLHMNMTAGHGGASGRFDYLWDNYDEDIDDENPDDLYDCKSINELIEKVSYPFSLVD